MPAPTTVDEFIDLIRKSAVLDEARLNQYVQKLKSDPSTPSDLNAVAGLFVRDGLLTYFQAEQFLQGRWKRFTIGKYKVLEKLGSGGMGQVFLCEHKLMRRRVAVKVLPTAKAQDPSSLDRFYREARAVAALDHPNIVRAYDIDQDDNLHFLVMEYVDGSSLQDIVRKIGQMDVLRACHYIYWAAVGLQHAHASGLIHRDIKPGNILVDRQGIVKILDLGLARFFNDDEDLLTKKYDESVLGTADYLAPEQAIDSHTVDGRADIYSLGATFYFLLAGHPPFAEGTVAQKLLWHQTRHPKPIRELRPDVPPELAAIIERMMAKKPEERYGSPGELAEALLPFTQKGIGPPPEDWMPQLSAAAQGADRAPASMATARIIQTMQRPAPPVTAPPSPPASVGPTPAPAARSDPKAPSSASRKPDMVPAAVSRPVAASEAAAPQLKPEVEPIAAPANPESPIWELISAETARASQADTERRRKDQSSRRSRPRSVSLKDSSEREAVKSGGQRSRSRSSLFVLLSVVGGLIVMVGGAGAIYWFVFRDKPKPPPPVVTEPRTLYLTRNPGQAPNHFDSFAQAAAVFRRGDTIVIKDDEWEEIASASRLRDLVLTAAEGKRVIWRAPPNKSAPHLLSLGNVDGAVIRGITFQGNGQVKSLVYLSGACSGLVLEDIEFVDPEVAGITLHDCVGQSSRPIQIRRVRIRMSPGREARAGVVFSTDPPPRPNVIPVGSQFIQLSRCLIEGPLNTGIQFEGSANGIEIKNCRFWKMERGIAFRRILPPHQAVWQASILSNTFHTMTGPAIHVEDINQLNARPENRLTMAQNFFASVEEVARFSGGDPNKLNFLQVSPGSNVRKQGTNPGVGMMTVEVNADVSTDPNVPARFLFYERSSPLFRAAGGHPAGATPD